MTIALTLTVNDGIVLASDSMTTLGDGLQTYAHANKIFNLYRDMPIGAIVWGSGSIGDESLATISKDFRKILMEHNGLNKKIYSIEEVANSYLNFLQTRAKELYNNQDLEATIISNIGFAVVGYSSESSSPETWQWNGSTMQKLLPRMMLAGCGSDYLYRLIYGISPNLFVNLDKLLGDNKEEFINLFVQEVWLESILPPPMPIMSTIELAEFLCQTACGMSRFLPGATTVGGPIEIAAITKHEGFKWVSRKHYFDNILNP